MSVSGIGGVTAKVQIPIAVKENTLSEERNESQVQKAAEQLKTDTAKKVSTATGVGQSVDMKI